MLSHIHDIHHRPDNTVPPSRQMQIIRFQIQRLMVGIKMLFGFTVYAERKGKRTQNAVKPHLVDISEHTTFGGPSSSIQSPKSNCFFGQIVSNGGLSIKVRYIKPS